MKSLSKLFILMVVVLLIFQSFFMVIKTYQTVDAYKKAIKPTAKASGVVSLCINTAPTLNTSNCSSNATQDVYYECWLNGSDPDYVNFTFSSVFTDISRAFNDSDEPLFNVAQDGFINFTPTNNDVGNFTILITINDGFGCENSENYGYFNLTVINVNDPPVFLGPIPDQVFREGEVLHAFYLNNYFTDPDLDPLSYTVSGNNQINIFIHNLTSEVIISSAVCDITEYVVFIAMDPYNETNISNVVGIRCIEEEPVTPPGGGEGPGGGGGAGITTPCKPEWECFEHHKCNRSNVKVMRCVDIHGCGEPDVYLTVPCKYKEEIECNESWNCSEWGPCLPNGTQYRTCVDLNDCGTEDDKPPIVQECEYIGTCDDGIKNCHNGSCEEGIDCGGPCPSCKAIEVPYPFEEERGILVYIITGIILLLLTAVLLYHYFRKEINAALAKAGWFITRKKKKQILLSQEDKKKLLSGIGELEEELGKVELFETLNKYSELLRYYLINVCKKNLSLGFDLNELRKVLDSKKRKMKEVLRKIFVSFFSKYLKIEKDKALITKRNITLLIEELRNLVLQTSEVEAEDVAREVKEFKVPEKASDAEKIIVRITNTYIALEFLELEIAKEKYLELLPEYEKLGLAEQEAVFEDISRLYNNISYVNSWFIKPKEVEQLA